MNNTLMYPSPEENKNDLEIKATIQLFQVIAKKHVYRILKNCNYKSFSDILKNFDYHGIVINHTLLSNTLKKLVEYNLVLKEEKLKGKMRTTEYTLKPLGLTVLENVEKFTVQR